MISGAKNADQPRQRLTTLDGLRGLAIIAVILNHLPASIWYEFLPRFSHFFLPVLFSNGKTGVMILFILTSFLMAWLHPQPKSLTSFLSRRYSRLLPPFLVMVTFLSIVKMFPNIPLLLEILVFLGVAVLAKLIWTVTERTAEKGKYLIGRWLFYGFVGFQAVVALGYVFWLQNIPPAVFYQTWSNWLQTLVSGAVNSTLTLPLGRYVAQLDGVYWSLVTELSFYYLYPLIFVPLLAFFAQKTSNSHSRRISVLVLLSLPFFFGLHLLSKRILRLDMMLLYLLIHFVVGASIGYNLEWWQHRLQKLKGRLSPSKNLLPAILAATSVLYVLVFPFLGKFFHPIVEMALAFVLGALLLLLTLPRYQENHWLQHPVLKWFGKYSYSLYLTHATAIGWAVQILPPTNLVMAVLMSVVSFVLSGFMSVFLYKMVEEPYFLMRKREQPHISMLQNAVLFARRQTLKMQNRGRWLLSKIPMLNLASSREHSGWSQNYHQASLGIVILSLALLYWAYKPPVALFTFVQRVSPPPAIDQDSRNSMFELSQDPSFFSFVSRHDNIGMILTSIKTTIDDSVTDVSDTPSNLVMHLFDQDNNSVARSKFGLQELGTSANHPFGFPLQPESRNQEFIVEYVLDLSDDSRQAFLDLSEGAFLVVSFVEKKALLNPLVLGSWGLSKLSEPFLNPYFWINSVLVLPFCLGLLAFTKKN